MKEQVGDSSNCWPLIEAGIRNGSLQSDGRTVLRQPDNPRHVLLVGAAVNIDRSRGKGLAIRLAARRVSGCSFPTTRSSTGMAVSRCCRAAARATVIEVLRRSQNFVTPGRLNRDRLRLLDQCLQSSQRVFPLCRNVFEVSAHLPELSFPDIPPALAAAALGLHETCVR